MEAGDSFPLHRSSLKAFPAHVHAGVGVHVNCMHLCTICIRVHVHACIPTQVYLPVSCVHIYTPQCLTVWECVCLPTVLL